MKQMQSFVLGRVSTTHRLGNSLADVVWVWNSPTDSCTCTSSPEVELAEPHCRKRVTGGTRGIESQPTSCPFSASRLQIPTISYRLLLCSYSPHHAQPHPSTVSQQLFLTQAACRVPEAWAVTQSCTCAVVLCELFTLRISSREELPLSY